MSEKIGIIGLGYVGLPLALALAKHYEVVGFDINKKRVEQLQANTDVTREATAEDFKNRRIQFTYHESDLDDCTFYIVAVPTPVDGTDNPDLLPLKKAAAAVGRVLKKGDVAVFESTVYPGATEDICIPILAQVSGLNHLLDFNVGYSPERINPGDKDHPLEAIVKVVSGDCLQSRARIGKVYETVIKAGIFYAQSIKVAEAAKVLENTQRDINIAIMNEFAMICEKVGIRTQDVLKAAGSKWNFLKFHPGLVGGHCIGVDPHYLAQCARGAGYHPALILEARRINDRMGAFIARKTMKLMCWEWEKPSRPKVGVLGITFKEDVADIRNSKVPRIVAELKEFGAEVLVHDPLADPSEVYDHYKIMLNDTSAFENLDALILAVPHKMYLSSFEEERYRKYLKQRGVLVDVKSVIPHYLASCYTYWSL